MPRRNYVYASGARSKPRTATSISEIFRAVAKINRSRLVRMNSQDVRLNIFTSARNYSIASKTKL